MKRALLLAAALLLVACGKKGDPVPPIPKIPARTTRLTARQQGENAILTFPFPSVMMDGEPLRDLARIDIFRLENPSPALSQKLPAATGTGGSDHAPIAGERARASAQREREAALLASARRIGELAAGDFAQATLGSQIIWRDSLRELFREKAPPQKIAYAIVTIRKNGNRSEFSNFAELSPVAPPGRPEDLLASPQEHRICLFWRAPEKNESGGKADIGGYNIYRRLVSEPDYAAPLNSKPVTATDYADLTPQYGNSYVYTITAVASGHLESEGAPAVQFGVDYRDIYPPAAVPRLDALPEQGVVHLIWTPVEAADLAGYNIYRATGAGKFVKLNAKLLVATTFPDTGVSVETTYRYRVTAVDKAGNESAPSPVATARPYTTGQ